MKKMLITYIFLLINICIMVKFIMYNEELIIFLSLVTAFSLLFKILKKQIINMYFNKIDEIYYHYYILIKLNK